ncbi:MAG: hypothetical protein V8R46_08675 [Eubacterium ramulus]
MEVKLNVSKLRGGIWCNFTPVGEALNRLLNEGLFEFENNVGAHVINIKKDVREIQEISFSYQMVAARNALRNGDAQQMAEEIEKYIEEYRSSNGAIRKLQMYPKYYGCIL